MPISLLWSQGQFVARSHERWWKMATLDRIAFIFPKMLNVVCFSHTLDNVGNHLVIPTLLEFGNVWIRLFRHSYKAKLLWKDLTEQRPRSYSETRWWSKWEVYRSEYRLILSRRATSILRVHFLRACFCLRHAALQTM